jgi:uncharacterized protein YbjQ (UPF0145 family)
MMPRRLASFRARRSRWVFGPFFLAALTVSACAESPPPAHAHTWAPLGHEARRYVHSTIAAAIVATPAPPPAKAAANANRAVFPPLPAPHKPDIRLFTADGADCPTEALGVVNERAVGDDKAALERLKDKARAMGADAIVGYRSAGAGGLGTDLAGVAVRCEQLAENRRYETVEHITVPVTEGAEQDAFDELLARADAMHANLVIDVHLQRDADGVGRKVVGAAIKYR